MTGNAVLVSPPARYLALRMVVEAWRAITRAQIRATFLFGCALLIYHVAFGQAPPGLRGTLIMLLLDQIKAFSLLLAVAVADRATGRDPDRRGVYSIAVVAGSVAAALLVAPTATFLLSAVLNFDVSLHLGPIIYISFELLILGGATIWVRNSRLRAEMARARLQSAELERIASAKRTVESELQAMQARVEPQFLFNTLSQVKQLYDQDSASGERMMDGLIAYLRAAMPRMRETSSTVGQEVELVRAYLGIVSMQLGPGFGFEFETAGGTTDVRMPPMMLLPLVDHAIAHRHSRGQTIGSIRIRIASAGDGIRVEVADSGDSYLPGTEADGITGIRERLATLFGNGAVLALREEAEGSSRAVLEFPFEPAAPPLGGAVTAERRGG